MAVAPSLNPPRLGDPIGPYEYVQRRSAVTQAGFWNEILADDPVMGPSSGLRVGVGVKVGRCFPLVWVHSATL